VLVEDSQEAEFEVRGSFALVRQIRSVFACKKGCISLLMGVTALLVRAAFEDMSAVTENAGLVLR